MKTPVITVAAVMLSAVLLGACGDGGVRELQAWMKTAQTPSRAGTGLASFSASNAFTPHVYEPGTALDPFSPDKLPAGAGRPKGAGGLAPDPNRRKELLEGFALDAIRMVGTIERQGIRHALLQVDRAVYQVVEGQRLGPNHGLVTAIAEDAVSVRETVADADGGWAQRMSRLELQAGKEKNK